LGFVFCRSLGRGMVRREKGGGKRKKRKVLKNPSFSRWRVKNVGGEKGGGAKFLALWVKKKNNRERRALILIKKRNLEGWCKSLKGTNLTINIIIKFVQRGGVESR